MLVLLAERADTRNYTGERLPGGPPSVPDACDLPRPPARRSARTERDQRLLDLAEQRLRDLYQVRKIRALLFHGLCRLGKIDWASEPHQELDRCLSRTITASKNFND